MDILEKLNEFCSWPQAVQDACIYHAQGEKAKRPRAKKPKQEAVNKYKRWSEDDRLLLFSLFEDHGWDHLLAPSWAKRFGRSVACISSQYHKQYLPWAEGVKVGGAE